MGGVCGHVLLMSYFVFCVCFHTNYYNLMTVVPVFYIMKDVASQEEKDWLLKIFYRIRFCLQLFPSLSCIFVVTRWPMIQWHGRYFSNGEYVMESVLSAIRFL